MMIESNQEVHFEEEESGFEARIEQVPDLFKQLGLLKEGEGEPSFAVGCEIIRVQDQILSIVTDAHHFGRFDRAAKNAERLRMAVDEGVRSIGFFIPEGEYTDPLWLEGDRAVRTFYHMVRKSIQSVDQAVWDNYSVNQGPHSGLPLSFVVDYVGKEKGMMCVDSFPQEELERALQVRVETVLESVEALLGYWDIAVQQFDEIYYATKAFKELDRIMPAFHQVIKNVVRGGDHFASDLRGEYLSDVESCDFETLASRFFWESNERRGFAWTHLESLSNLLQELYKSMNILFFLVQLASRVPDSEASPLGLATPEGMALVMEMTNPFSQEARFKKQLGGLAFISEVAVRDLRFQAQQVNEVMKVINGLD